MGESSIKTSWLEGHYKGLEEGMEKGREEGIEKGREEGIEKGREEAKLEVARRLIAKGMTVEEAAEIAGVGVEELRTRV